MSRVCQRAPISDRESCMRVLPAIGPESERGQAMTEYLVLLFGAMLLLLSLLVPMRAEIRSYMQSIYFCATLPFP